MERIARTTFLGEIGDQTVTVRRGQKIDPTDVQAKALVLRGLVEPLEGDEQPEPAADPLNPGKAKTSAKASKAAPEPAPEPAPAPAPETQE